MSNKRSRKRQPVERASLSGLQQNAWGVNNQGVTIPYAVLANMLQKMAPQKTQAKDFAPGSPIQPYSGVVPVGGPRVFDFPVGINLNNNDRTLGRPDVPGFVQLRNLAALYSGITLCERVILDMIPKLKPQVSLREDLAKQGAEEKDYQTEMKPWRVWAEMPDPVQKIDVHTWLRTAWIDQTQVDAVSIFKQKDRSGRLMAFNLVDGATIKPLLTERGMVPQPPYPAWQQYPYGVPGDQYTTDQMVYYRESPRSFTPYGFSRVERIIMEVNQALRKKRKDLSNFTEGNIPQSFMEVPESTGWTPDQIDSYEQSWNALLAGNLQQQVRIKFLQPGMKYTPAEQYQMLTDFDRFLLNVSVASYGLSMGDIGFTEDIHKSSGDSQQNMMFRRTLAPLISVYAHILTSLVAEATRDDRFTITFTGFEESEDMTALATAYSSFANIGAISPANVARAMKFPEVPETGPFLLPKGGQPIFLEDLANPTMRKAQQDAQMAGLQMAAQAPDQQQEDDNEQSTSPTTKGKTQSDSDTGRGNSKDASGGAEKSDSGASSEGANRAKAVSAEYRRWRTRAIEDAKAGRPQRVFQSELIPHLERYIIATGLDACHSPDDVRALFETVRTGAIERDTHPKELASVSGGSQPSNKSDWKPRW